MPNYPAGSYYEGYSAFAPLTETYMGARVLRVPMIPRARGRAWNLLLNYFSAAFAKCLRVPFLAAEQWDCIFVFQPSPITTALPARFLRALTGVPVVLWIQDVWPETLAAVGAVRSPLALRAVDVLVRWIYSGTDRILVQSKAFRESVMRLAPKHADRIDYFPNTAEDFYKPVAPEIHAGDPELPDGFLITFAGNIGAAQDFNTILSAAELLRYEPSVHWVIAGDGRERAWVEEQIRARDLQNFVHLIGRYPVETMPRLFARSDALLVTLRREPIFSLTIPSKVQSYLACGKPILAALEGEGARVVEEAGAGLTCAPEDPEALAGIARSLMRMKAEDRMRMGEAGRRYFETEFDRESLLNQLESWLHEAGTTHARLPDVLVTRN
jgi:glycosyltransferase involved in cell wall biosynthesis